MQTGIVLEVAQQAGLNLILRLGTTEETITVTGESPLVDVANVSALGRRRREDDRGAAAERPQLHHAGDAAARHVQFTERQSTPRRNAACKLNINGMGGRSNSYLIDGANMRGYAGQATVRRPIPPSASRPSRSSASSPTPLGRLRALMGGVISIATKSGTNDMHGSAFEFFRDSGMDARNFFDRGDPAPFTRHQFGGTVGGPILQNKLFFFGGYERLQEDLGTTVITAVPTAPRADRGFINPAVKPYLDLYPLPNGRDLGPGMGQYTYEFNARDAGELPARADGLQAVRQGSDLRPSHLGRIAPGVAGLERRDSNDGVRAVRHELHVGQSLLHGRAEADRHAESAEHGALLLSLLASSSSRATRSPSRSPSFQRRRSWV